MKKKRQKSSLRKKKALQTCLQSLRFQGLLPIEEEAEVGDSLLQGSPKLLEPTSLQRVGLRQNQLRKKSTLCQYQFPHPKHLQRGSVTLLNP